MVVECCATSRKCSRLDDHFNTWEEDVVIGLFFLFCVANITGVVVTTLGVSQMRRDLVGMGNVAAEITEVVASASNLLEETVTLVTLIHLVLACA